MRDDAQLLRSYAKENSEAAFRELVERHLRLVYSAALRQVGGDAALAQDVAQRVFTDLARKAGALGGRAVLAGWLYTSTRYAAAQVVRGEQRRRAREAEAQRMNELFSAGEGAESVAEWEQLRPVIDGALHTLGECDREAVLMRFFEGRAFADVGAALNVSEDAARVRINRALEKLRGLLARRGIKSTAAALGGVLAGNAAVAAPAGMAASVTAAVTAAVTGMGVGVSVAGGATGASVGSFLTFMSTTKTMVGVLSVIAAVAVGTAVREHGDVERARADIEKLRAERESSIARVGELEGRVRELQAELRVAEQSRPAPPPDGTPASVSQPTAPTAAGVLQSAAGRLDRILSDPSYQDLSLKTFRAGLRATYAPLYQRLGLSPAVIERLETQLVERKQQQLDLAAAARAQGVSISDPALQKLNAGDGDSQMRSLLGDSVYRELVRYEELMPARAAVEPLSASLQQMEVPLSREQRERLTEIIAARTRRGAAQGMVELPGEIDWGEVLVEAETLLSSAQFDMLQAQRQRADLEKQLFQLRAELLKKARGVP